MLFDFLPNNALPPEHNISPALRHLAECLAAWIAQRSPEFNTTPLIQVNDGLLPILRLLSPFGDVTGLAAKPEGHPTPLLCVLAGHLANHFEQPATVIEILQGALMDEVLLDTFPSLANTPGPNDNVLWNTHARVITAPTYDLLAHDLQVGLVELVSRTDWQRSHSKAKSLDARLAGLFRILPELGREPFVMAYAQQRDVVCGHLIWRVARSLCHLQTGAPLNHRTRLNYFDETCRLLNHPQWADAQRLDSKLGLGSGNLWPESRLMNEDDDLPETPRAPDAFRSSEREKVEKKVRHQLYPGASLEAAAEAETGLSQYAPYGEEFAIMREYHSLSAWNCLHPHDASKILKDDAELLKRVEALPHEQLQMVTLHLSVLLTGRSAKWLGSVLPGDWNRINGLPDGLDIPQYLPEHDAIAYWPVGTPQLPKQPLNTADLFEPVSRLWLLPLPAQLIPLWRRLAGRPKPGGLLEAALANWPKELNRLTQLVRAQSPRRPAVTEGRLRVAYTALMEHVGQLDPVLAAFVSEQWQPALRVPLFYTTISAQFLADRYRSAAGRVWQFLREMSPSLPLLAAKPKPQPQIYQGSPYRPKVTVIKEIVKTLQTAIDTACTEEDRHNARLLKLLYGCSLFMGLRISEAGELDVTQIDLKVNWGGGKMPWLTLPETKANRWTTSSRIVPIPEPLQPLIHELMSTAESGPAFYFIYAGQQVKADGSALRQALAKLNVQFPRWHAGRHLLRCLMLEASIPFEVINAVLGHQSAGHELFNPYLPGNVTETWTTYLGFVSAMADRIGWTKDE